MRKQKMKEYLQTIYVLQRDGVVRSVNIAKEMNLSRPTVSTSLHQLADQGYIKFEENLSVYLTASGHELAKEAIYEAVSRGMTYHKLLENFDYNSSDIFTSVISDQKLEWLKRQKAESLLEAVFILSNHFFCVRTVDVAHYLNKTSHMVVKKLISLEEHGFLTTGEHFSLSLTNLGLYYAEQFYSKHEKLRSSLIAAGNSNQAAEMKACRIPIEYKE